jgi:hypothetical protein
MFLVLTQFMFQEKGELECVWCSMLQNFTDPLKIKESVKIFNIWRNVS